MNKAAMRKAFHNWDAFNAVNWDTAVCLHVPNQMRVAERGWDARWLERVVRRYFNRVDRRIFKSAYLRRGEKTYRFVTAEYSLNVGWHCHFIAATPTIVSQADFRHTLKDEWLWLTRKYASSPFKERLAWVEPIADTYAYYCTKHAFSELSDDAAHQSQSAKGGRIDLENTYFVV